MSTESKVVSAMHIRPVSSMPQTLSDASGAIRPSMLVLVVFIVESRACGRARVPARWSNPTGKKEPADFARVARILQDAGYRGYLVLEYEDDENPKEAIPRHIDTLRKIIGR
ncbi:MAG: hypothetical protein SGI88_15470 [Candidatus Hydrogenedentes bacterium]|nr:hypothetical protein [Candidatus Hydrogenedentota bacterium]